MKHMLAFAPTFLVCASISAQHVLPIAANIRDGNTSTYAPFVYDAFRAQQIWDANTVAPNAAVLSALSWRRDAQDNSALGAGMQYTTLNMSIGSTSVSPTTMTTTFASNATGGLTSVHNGPLNLPAQVPAAYTGPFNVNIPFTQPYPYLVSSGNLIAEWDAPGNASQKVLYTLDAEYWGQDGRVWSFGTPGSFSGNVSPRIYYNASQTPISSIIPGGQCAVRVTSLPTAAPTVIYFGLSTTSAGVPLPFDLGMFGAPGNTLYTSLDAVSGTQTPTPAGSRYEVNFPVNIPNNPALAGGLWYNQSVSLDPGANTLGAVFSDALAVLIGGITQAPETQMIYSSSSSATGGYFVFGSSRTAANAYGGLVVELTGSFQ